MTFLKWIGGKSQLLSEFSELFPDMNNIKGYIEPFLGGGSVFFYLMENFNDSLSKKNIYLSDANPELINCYKVVRDNLDELLPLLEKHQERHCEDYYYKIRDSYFLASSNIERAGAFIYLNKTCFNGLWRLNKDGIPNAAIGHKGRIDIYNDGIIKSNSLLQGVNLNVISFEKILDINKGNLNGYFVYCCLPGIKIRMLDERLLNIEDVKIGDKTFIGGDVLNVIEREYNGTIFEIEVTGIYDNLSVTEEHPLAIVRQMDAHAFKNKHMSKFKDQQILDLLNIRFMMTRDISVGDFLLVITKGNKKFILAPITKIIRKEYKGNVYNLTTDNNIYVANYILNHNCDPPYYNVDRKGNFTRYTSDDFHISKRLLVPKVFKELDRLGCKVMLSNSDSPIIHKEFKDFNIKILKAKRIVNSDGKNRGYVYEVVVMNYQEYKRQMTIEDAWG